MHKLDGVSFNIMGTNLSNLLLQAKETMMIYKMTNSHMLTMHKDYEHMMYWVKVHTTNDVFIHNIKNCEIWNMKMNVNKLKL